MNPLVVQGSGSRVEAPRAKLPAMPRHLRFARAVALLSGLGACGAPHAVSGPSAGSVTVPPASNRNGQPTTTVEPAPPPTVLTAGICDCSCYAGDPRPACAQVGSFAECCDSRVIEGPLPPPDLPG